MAAAGGSDISDEMAQLALSDTKLELCVEELELRVKRLEELLEAKGVEKATPDKNRVNYILRKIKGTPEKKDAITPAIFRDVEAHHLEFEERFLDACKTRYNSTTLTTDKALELLGAEVKDK